MFNSQIVQKLLPCLALTSCLATIVPGVVRAESSQGFTLLSGVDSADRLNHRLDSGTKSVTDRYYLRIPGSRINRLGAGEIQITYPNYYKGTFDSKNVEVRVGDKSIPIADVKWDRENKTLKIDLAEQLKTQQEIEVVLNNVKNPDQGGMYYFNCQVKSSAEFPIARYVGTWILSID